MGIRRRTVFGPGFYCHGGSCFCTLRAECARYVRDYARANPEMVAFFRAVLVPEEVLLHSVLANSGRFDLTPDYKRYINWTGCTQTHPRNPRDRGPSRDAGQRRPLGAQARPAAEPTLFNLLD